MIAQRALRRRHLGISPLLRILVRHIHMEIARHESVPCRAMPARRLTHGGDQFLSIHAAQTPGLLSRCGRSSFIVIRQWSFGEISVSLSPGGDGKHLALGGSFRLAVREGRHGEGRVEIGKMIDRIG